MPFVHGVRVTVYDYAALYFARRGVCTHNVARIALVKQRIQKRRVQHELEEHRHKRKRYAHEHHNGGQKVYGDRKGHKHRHKICPAEERVRSHLERVAVHFVAHFAQLTRHIVKGFVFALTAGVAVAEVDYDVFYLVTDVGNAFFAFLSRNLSYSHNPPAFNLFPHGAGA